MVNSQTCPLLRADTSQSNDNASWVPCVLARLIHISPELLGTIYRSFETTLEWELLNVVGIQIQCSMEIHCFKKHSF